jgi:hypothetical protein
MTLELDIDVPESRTVTITLPPDTPTGRARVSVAVGPPPTPAPFVPVLPLAREVEAFDRLLPALLKTHRGQYVAVYQGTVVGTGADKLAVAREAYDQFGPVDVLVRLVAERQPVLRVSGPRLVRPEAG